MLSEPKIVGVGVARNEPEKLLRHATPEDTLCGEERKRVAQIEAHVSAKLADGARACPVALVDTRLQDVPDQIQVLVFCVLLVGRSCLRTIGGTCLSQGALVDKDLEFVLDSILFLDTIERLAICFEPHAQPSATRLRKLIPTVCTTITHDHACSVTHQNPARSTTAAQRE